MSFDYREIDLPIVDVLENIKQSLINDTTLIVKAPPGAGKSSIVPLALLNEEWLGDQKIIMLEPRRLAAKSIATRMSELLGEQVGGRVGYRIRFDTKVSSSTQIEVVTEGILTRMLHQDNGLEGVGAVIFDEFHERSIHADIAMALCRESQQILRQDLRIVVMSATLNMPELSELLEASVVESEGRQYPVNIEYCGDADWRILPEMISKIVNTAVNKHKGDILVFLPGQAEIRKTEELLKRSLKGIKICPLYGQLAPVKQAAAIFPDREGKRKVVLATTIAETSLTIEGVSVVIDSGFTRTSRFDPKSSLSRLETVQVSKDSADQRAGRAGRLGPGHCYRMWTKVTQSRLKEQAIPEIEQADLSSLVLDLAHWGIMDANQLAWLSPPPRGNLAQASELLHDLGALADDRITEHGKAIHRIPTQPRIAHMLIKAEELGMISLATDLAAIMEERDPMPKETGIDINLRILALRKQRQLNSFARGFSKIEKVAKQYRSLFSIEADNDPIDELEAGLLIAHAYPERIAYARPGNNAQFQMANGRFAAAGHQDDLAHETWLAIANVNDRDKSGRIFLASPVDPSDLKDMIKIEEVIKWDTRDGGLIAAEETRIGNIVLRSKALPDPDNSELVDAIVRAVVKEGDHLLDWNDEVEQLLNRVNSLKKWNQFKTWPDFNKEVLIKTNADWLSPYLNSVKNPQDLKKINLKEVLFYSLEAEVQQKIEKLAPERIAVPSGSKIKLLYQANTSAPVLAVRLQECFGLLETPTINNGSMPVLMHLLSPGYKVVQITSDLASFWNEAYFDVKKDLKRRYPKHAWPENPLDAKAIRGVKRK